MRHTLARSLLTLVFWYDHTEIISEDTIPTETLSRHTVAPTASTRSATKRPAGWLSRAHKQGWPRWRRLRLGFLRWRFRLEQRPRLLHLYRIAIGCVGTIVSVIGLILVPLPGPGWLIVTCGIAIIASEFAWAKRLLRFVGQTLSAWTRWLRQCHWGINASLGTGTLLITVAALWLVFIVLGLPAWVDSEWVPHWSGLR